MSTITPDDRIAAAGERHARGQVVLMNGFVVAPDRDEAFKALWDTTSEYFKARPGFVSLRLHRSVSADAPHRWVNVATWETEDDYRAAHSTPEFRQVVTAPGWEEFPSSPQLFEVVTVAG
jgi:heme-degrading monooxygenase HmoA